MTISWISGNPRTWVSHWNGQDLAPAILQFGDGLVYLTEGKLNTFQTDNMYRDLCVRLKEFAPEDSLLVCGSPIVNMLVILALKNMGLKQVRVQLYHQKEKCYFGRTIRL
jgi:hypothetical protein